MNSSGLSQAYAEEYGAGSCLRQVRLMQPQAACLVPPERWERTGSTSRGGVDWRPALVEGV